MKSLSDPIERASIRQRIEALQPGATARWGRMNVHQMMCHLNDSFQVAAGEREVSQATGPLQRTIVKWFALHVPLPWPKGLPTRPEIDQRTGGTPPTEFERDRQVLLEHLERFPRLAFQTQRHPIFGGMSVREWLRWGYLHVDHHLRQFGV